ncbi:hypothetical protein NKG05_10065 [Oerskovia sp. M15]
MNANLQLDPENLATEFDKLSASILADENAVVRFDASDLMPGAVGAGTFWTGIVDWLTGSSTQEVVDEIEASWRPPDLTPLLHQGVRPGPVGCDGPRLSTSRRRSAPELLTRSTANAGDRTA